MKRSLLEKLAPYSPMNQDEMGGCVFCGGMPPGERYGYSGRFLSDHEAGCPWVKARRALGDTLPSSRGALRDFMEHRLPMTLAAARALPCKERGLLRELLGQNLAVQEGGRYALRQEGVWQLEELQREPDKD